MVLIYITKYIQRLRNSAYGKSLVVLTGGTFAAQLVPIILVPIISRLFTPEQIGSAAVFSQIAAIIAIIMSGGYIYAIFIAKSDKEAVSLVYLTILLAVTVLLVLLFFFWGGRSQLSMLFKEPLLTSLYFIPLLSAFFIVIYQCYNEWCVRRKSFKQLSYNKLLNSSSISLTEASFGVCSPYVLGNGRIIGEVIGRFLSALSCVISVIRVDFKLFMNNLDFRIILSCLKKYSNFPKLIMTGKLLNSISCGIPIFCIGVLFTKEELGWFSMANTIIAVPVSVITIAASDAFRQRANIDYTTTGSCRRIVNKTLLPLTILSLIGFTILYLIAPTVFGFILGENWVEAGCVVRFLIPMVTISLVSEVIRPIFIIADKKHYDFIWQVLFLVSMLLLVIITRVMDDFKIFLILFSLIKSLLFLLQFYWCYKFSTQR